MSIDEIRTDLITALKVSGQYLLDYQGPSSAIFTDFANKDDFANAIAEAVVRLEQKDDSPLEQLQLWFLPSSDWDDLAQNLDIGNKVSGLIDSYIRLINKK